MVCSKTTTSRALPPPSILCPRCGETVFLLDNSDLVCAACDHFAGWLDEPGAPPSLLIVAAEDMPVQALEVTAPPGWCYVAYVRQSDGGFRPIAKATTLAGAWDVAWHSWQAGDLLVMPVRTTE